MDRMLSRSKSLRMLRGGQKEIHQQDSGHPTPKPIISQLDLDTLKAATPVTRTEGRADMPDMVQRPRTSSGTSDRGKLFHRKVVHVATSPDDTKHSLSLPSQAKSTTTLIYTAEIHEDTEGVIGIALGSPTMNPAWNTTPNGTELGTFTHISSNFTPVGAVEASQEAPKPKLSRWKSLFGRQTPNEQAQKPSFYQLAQSVVPPRADSHHDDEGVESRSISRADDPRDETRSMSPPIFRPDLRETCKLPKDQEQPKIESRPRALTTTTSAPNKLFSSLIRSASSPKPSPKHSWSKSPSIPIVLEQQGSQKSPVPTIGGSLLDVEIPNVKLDRYSVMFGSLLQSDSNSNSNLSSSLLIRRQGNSERLKPLNELSAKKHDHQSRLTSPSYPRSPSVALSLFPRPTGNRAPSPRVESVHRPRPPQHSKTAPINSPHRQRFPISDISDGGARGSSQEKLARQESPKFEVSNTTTQILTHTPSSLHSFDSDSEEVAIVVSASREEPWKPLLSPQWEIIDESPQRTAALRSHATNNVFLNRGPSSAPLESVAGDRKPRNPAAETPIEQVLRSADRAPAMQPAIQTRSEHKLQTTTVGVARSVSVSRASPRSADVLKPSIVRRATEKSLSPASGRFIDQKPLTPTLVQLQHRKSQRVQLVDA